MPQDDNNSFLGSAAVAAPFVAGTSVGLRNIMRDTKIVTAPNAIENMQRVANEVKNSKVDVSSHLRFMNREFAGGKNADIAKSAWQAAVSRVDPVTRKQLLDFTASIDTMSDIEATEAIRNTMQRNDSLAMRNVYSKFQRNAAALQRQQKMYRGLPITFQGVSATAAPFMPGFGLPADLSTRLNRITSTLLSGDPSYRFRSTPELAKRGLGVFNINIPGLPGGDLSFNLPLSNQGISIEGLTMQTQRISPTIGIVEDNKLVKKMSREQFFLEQFEKSIVPDIQSGRLGTRREIKSAVANLREQVFTQLESTSTIFSKRKTAAQQLRDMQRGQQIQLVSAVDRITENKTGFVSAYRPIVGQELSDVMEQNRLFGGTSPTAVSKGIVMQEDISKLFLAPEAKDWGRRPEAAFREYQLSNDAINNLQRIQAERFARYQSLQSTDYIDSLKLINRGLPISPSLATVYVDPSKQTALLEQLYMREGHAVMSKEIGEALEFESVQSMKLKQIRSDLVEKLGKGAIPIGQGQILGYDVAGNVVTATDDMTLLRMNAAQSLGEGDFAYLEYIKKHRITHGDKFFEGTKSTVLMTNTEQQLKKLVNKQIHFNNIETIVNMDALKKDRQLFRRQLVTSLQEELGIEAQKIVKFATTLSTKSQLNDAQFVQGMMKFGTAVGLNPEQFGRTFGTVPYVLGEDIAANITKQLGVSPAAVSAMQIGIAGGVSKLAFGGPTAITGAGTALGSLEPRIFEALRDPQWGTLGKDISREFTERMITTDPNKLLVSQAMEQSLLSMTGELTAGPGSNIFDVSKEFTRRGFREWAQGLENKGGWIRQGKGLQDIFMPSSQIVEKMRPFTTTAGTDTIGDLSHMYENIAENAARMHLQSGGITTQEAITNMQQYTDEMVYHWAPGGKGMGGYLRGKLTGSRYLRAVSQAATGEIIEDLSTVGITSEMFNKMALELDDQYGQEAIIEMQKRFAKGGRIGGLIARHPTIGPFSMQQVFFEKIGGEESQIVLPERQLDLTMSSGQRAQIKLGPAVGMAADYDADNVAAFLVSPKHEAAIRSNLNNTRNSFTNAYAQHQVRYQLLKAGKAEIAADGLTIAQRMAADVQKIGTTQTWVPQLSTEMSRARTALGMYGRGPAAENAKMLLEWLEQTPISAKHLTSEQVRGGGIDEMMNRIQYSLRNRDVASMKSVVKQITSQDQIAKESLIKDIQLTRESAATLSSVLGTDVSTTLRGTNIDTATNELMRSLGEARDTDSDRAMKILSGRARKIKFDEISSVIKSATVGTFSNVSRSITTTSNILGSIGRGVIRNKKPLGWGFAGSLAIASLLSSPEETIGPGNALNIGIKPNMSPGKGSDRMNPENLMPHSPPVGNPSVPNMLYTPRTFVNTPSQRININATIPPNIDPNNLANRLNTMTNRNTSINIRDDRQPLNPYKYANTMV